MCRSVILWVLLCSSVAAHEMTPTYPKWEVSLIDSVHKTTMRIFNKRQDVKWYEIGVFDKEWKPIPFVTAYRILPVGYLKEVTFDVYITENNIKRARYVCSLSKLRSSNESQTLLATRICSKFK